MCEINHIAVIDNEKQEIVPEIKAAEASERVSVADIFKEFGNELKKILNI